MSAAVSGQKEKGEHKQEGDGTAHVCTRVPGTLTQDCCGSPEAEKTAGLQVLGRRLRGPWCDPGSWAHQRSLGPSTLPALPGPAALALLKPVADEFPRNKRS